MKNPLEKQVGGDHYKEHLNPIEFYMGCSPDFALFNASKYVLRHREKNGIQDLEKAIHYVEFLEWFYPGVVWHHYYKSFLDFLAEKGIGQDITVIDFHTSLFAGRLEDAKIHIQTLIHSYENIQE